MTTTDGTVIAGKYRIEGLIGESGHSWVYAAIQLRLERRLALRRLRRDVVRSRRIHVLGRARICSRLAHPNILGVYELGEDDGRAFVAMELLEGESLRAKLERGGQLAVQDVARLGAGVLGALSIAHEAGVVHPSLSPEKVFMSTVRGGLIPKLSDFQDGRDEDPRDDLHAAGMILYQALTGSLPFALEEDTPSRLPLGPSEVRDDVGLDADAFTTRALMGDVDARFQTAEEMLDAWSSIASVEPHLRA